MEVPQRAQGIYSLLVEFEMPTWNKCEDSMSKAVKDMGSIVNWPLCMAARTERLDSQFNDGARSNRTVGSLNQGIWC